MQAYDFFLALHLYTLYASAFLMLFYLGLTQGNFKTEFIFIRRVRLFLPVFYLFLTLALFTGLLLWALKGFEANLRFFVMLLIWILILALAIFQFVLFKKARSVRRYVGFRWASLAILLVELLLLMMPFIDINYAIFVS
ncbi:hypothetical protein E0379_02805 [Campylobacter upsaliensis]|uniref:hypothetical protein n=1 Tax=Campylobacter upsaliensis TaxID=28080 RepID=UPI0012700794|nr:hypothetical protein [Campylobacter upsaliensis]EAI0686769.1 hypothetical protein [Campylobacter upsaliensis]EAI7128571.1 hypothetical protein [Campylobacter upsaliensis]EAI7259324.1 hypothetical protein [Campylobacter upsaliensis]EAJ1632389.1 hypothetical protein [Campylobacter upsaliensis]EAJ1689280.1 hypothetical protein [Campylobacter upsaliensis]